MVTYSSVYYIRKLHIWSRREICLILDYKQEFAGPLNEKH